MTNFFMSIFQNFLNSITWFNGVNNIQYHRVHNCNLANSKTSHKVITFPKYRKRKRTYDYVIRDIVCYRFSATEKWSML